MQKRFEREFETENRPDNSASVSAYETERSISSGPVAATKHDDKRDEDKMSLFWRVFGGTILSIVALAAITLYTSLSNSIGELRSDLNHEREARAALVKKDDVDASIKAQYERIRTIEGYKADIEAMKERVAANALASETVKKDLGASFDALKKDTSGLEIMKERIGLLEGVKKDVAAIDPLKERFAILAADLKIARDDIQKAQQELERNKASDLERKAARDAQAKQLEETIKELQKGVQACREKVARLEGSQFVGPPERQNFKP